MSRKTLFVLAGPVLFTVVLGFMSYTRLETPAASVLALLVWMLTWWVSEAVPLAVTALLPLALFPLLGVLPIDQAALAYGNPVIFLFLGGFILALALEKHRLHERLALLLIRVTGSGSRGILLGFMLATGFLSMWISNTATAIMMLPIALSVVDVVRQGQRAEVDHAAFQKFSTSLMLGIAYAASIGGMATLIGSPPNAVMVASFRKYTGMEFTFLDWIKIGLPVSLALLGLCYLLLSRVLYPVQMKALPGSESIVEAQLRQLGPLTAAGRTVLIIFTMVALLWIFRPLANYGLGLLGLPGGLDDTGIAIWGAVLMFIVPSDWRKGTFLLGWEDARQISWGILLLFGGGLCLAEGLTNTGWVARIGQSLLLLEGVPLVVVLLAVTFLSIVLTEIMSNVALTMLLVPVVIGVSNSLGWSPLLLALPVTLGASCGFAMPISTPPNAVLYSSGYVTMRHMVRAGVWMNLVAWVVIALISLVIIPLLG